MDLHESIVGSGYFGGERDLSVGLFGGGSGWGSDFVGVFFDE